jgi:hypothetical protein
MRHITDREVELNINNEVLKLAAAHDTKIIVMLQNLLEQALMRDRAVPSNELRCSKCLK